MLEGRLLKWDELKIGIGSSTFSLTDTNSAATTIDAAIGAESKYAPTITTFVKGAEVVMSYQYVVATGVTTATATLSIPDLSISESKSKTGTTGTAHVIFEDWSIYVVAGSTWIARWSAIKWFVDGVLQKTFTAGSKTGGYMAAAGVPFFGMPPAVGASASANPVPIKGVVTHTNQTTKSNITGSGGWEFDDGTGLDTLLVTPATLPAVPGHGGPCTCVPDGISFSATNTFNCTANAAFSHVSVLGSITHFICTECTNGTADPPFEYDVSDDSDEVKTSASNVTALPNLTRAINRLLGTDSFGWWDRFGLPKTEAQASNSCTEEIPPDTVFSNQTIVEIHAQYLREVEGVDDSSDTIEDPLSDVCFAPCGFATDIWTVTETIVVITDVGACPIPDPEDPPGDPIECFTRNDSTCDVAQAAGFPSTVQTKAQNSGIAGQYDHTDLIARYASTIAAVLWQYVLYATLDVVSGPQGIFEWFVDGVRRNWSDYWGKLRTQFGLNPDLPGAEETFKRNSIITEPLMSGGLATSFFKNLLYGQQTSFVGVSRFDVLDYTVPATFAYDNTTGALFSTIDCAIVLNVGDITVNPDAGKNDVVVELALSSFTEDPRLLPQIMQKIDVGWNTTNVVALNVYLVNAHGDKVLLTSSSSAGALDRPVADDSKYAVSSGQDRGVGVVSDTGTDALADGESAAVMASAKRVHTYELLRGRGAAKLRFEIEVSDPDVDVTIDYPILSKPTTDAKILYENGNHAAIVWANGGGMRIGNLSYESGGSVLATPTVEQIDDDTLTTVVDMLAIKNNYLEGLASSDDVTTDLAALYDTNEGQSIALADADTHAFVIEGGLAGIFCLVNSYREVPPAANLPVFDRNATTLVPTTAYVNKVWAAHQGPRYIVFASDSSDLTYIDPSDSSDILTVSALAAGWQKGKFDPVLDNSEPDFLLKLDDTLVHKFKPWNGAFAVLDLLGAIDVFYDVSLSFRHVRAIVKTGNVVWIGIHEPSLNAGWVDTETNPKIIAEKVCIRWDKTGKNQTLYLWTVESGALKFRTSDDQGTNFSVATEIAAANVTDVGSDISFNGLRYHYWIEGTDPYDAKGRIYDPQDNEVIAVFTAVSDVDQFGITAQDFITGQGKHKLGLHVIQSGALKFFQSPEGVNFS